MPYALLHSSQHAKALLFGLRLSRTSESAPGTIFRPILAQNTGPPPPDPFVRHTCHRIVWNVLHATEGSVIATQWPPLQRCRVPFLEGAAYNTSYTTWAEPEYAAPRSRPNR